MSIDFEIPAEAKAIRLKVRQWVQDECIPAEARLHAGDDYKTVLGELRKKARAQGLWCPFIPKEHGGMGLGPLANALVQMELGESYLGALSMNTQGPDDATMLTLLVLTYTQVHGFFLQPKLCPCAHSIRTSTQNLSSINLVSTFRCSSSPHNTVYTSRVDVSTLGCCLSSHRHSYMSLPFISRFID